MHDMTPLVCMYSVLSHLNFNVFRLYQTVLKKIKFNSNLVFSTKCLLTKVTVNFNYGKFNH